MSPVSTTSPSPPREWMPHIWEGCDFVAWMRLLSKNGAAVHPRHWYIAAIITAVSAGHTGFRWLQDAWFGDLPPRQPLAQPPLFILGHWRTGTTLLHELLIRDERHSYPTTYQCLAPHHFLLSERFFTRHFQWLLPSRRPMDNMPAGWDRPQEDEFALCMMGQPSPYLRIAFPNRPQKGPDGLEIEELSPRAQGQWKQAFLGFLKRVSFRSNRRLVLKSPTHTCRIPTLLELFPGARFVHIVRNPYAVFPSTVNLWKTLYETHGMQVPTFDGLEERVLDTFVRMYDRLEKDRSLIPSGQFHELRYEDLIANPMGRMRALYDALGLGGFDKAQARMEQYLAKNASYRTNRYSTLSPRLRDEIARRWGPVIRRYGYDKDQPLDVPLAS